VPARAGRYDITDPAVIGVPAERLESSAERWGEMEFFE
jgi:hypothetical protein